MEKYHTSEQMRQFEELRNETPAEEVKAVEEAWTALLVDVRAARSLDPSSPEAKAIAFRWDELLARTMSYYARRPGTDRSRRPELRSRRVRRDRQRSAAR